MFVHLSKTSPYVCDISLGPIEQANRMALASTKMSMPYLDIKESFPRLQPIRTPLKLLAPDEVPMDTSSTTTHTDTNPSRQPSLQPIWYSEQTIVDEQQRNSLPTIESDSPNVEDEIIEKESLMRKSSTFTIEQRKSFNVPAKLNESEKENDVNIIMTSTQKSDESFRALEHLLGLGSANVNLTMTTTTHESPKSNHESLSLTVVTPTELINQTTASLQISYAPAGGGSLPSSQNILLMPTIESITEPSMNSTIPPPFLVDDTDVEDPSSTAGTVVSQEKNDERSFEFTDEDDDSKQNLQKDDTNTDDESNFSFELNDFGNTSKDSTNEQIPSVTTTTAPMITIRAPTCADVAYRALIKSRTGGRISQPVKVQSPLARSDRIPVTVRSSLPTTTTTRVLRSSTRQLSSNSTAQSTTSEESFINESKPDDDYPRIELVEVVSLSEEEDETENFQQDESAAITLNLTETKLTNSTVESDHSASLSSLSSCTSTQQDTSTVNDPQMPVLSYEYSYNTPAERITRSMRNTRQSFMRSTDSNISPIPEQQTSNSEEEKTISSDSLNASSKFSSPKHKLSRLSTNPTVMSEAPAIILHKSLAGSASPSPNQTPIITIRKSERLSSNLSPRQSMNPLHSSTPSSRNKSMQMVSIGEQEQILTTVRPQLNIDSSNDDVEMIDNEQQANISMENLIDEGIQTSPERPKLRIHISTQTTPSLDLSSRRCFQTIEQQTTPMAQRSSASSGCQTTPIPIPVQRSNIQQTSPMKEIITKTTIDEQSTPVHSKALLQLRRNVRFQFTPSTDARLAEKEKLEEQQKQQRRVKQEIIIENIKPTVSDNEREDDTEDEMKNSKKNKKKSTKTKKKQTPPTKPNDESSEEMNESSLATAEEFTRRITRHQSQKDTTDDEQHKSNDIHVTSTTNSKKKISKQTRPIEKPVSPVKQQQQQPDIIVTTTSPSTLPTKRNNRKRPNPKLSNSNPPSENTSPTEPISKRPKTTKTIVEVKENVRTPSPEAPSTRSRSKTPAISTNSIKTASKTSSKVNVPETQTTLQSTNKRKNTNSAMKKGKRRLHSVEQDEGLNTADEEETIQIISPPVETKSIELMKEEREKIENLTVAELKTRLATHNENVPKGTRKADLVALLIKIETRLLNEKKESEISKPEEVIPENSTSRKTRRKK